MTELNEASLAGAMEKMWLSGGRPEEVQIRDPEGLWEVILLEDERERICTPAGLKAIFPALK